jgi:hypothetical protein
MYLGKIIDKDGKLAWTTGWEKDSDFQIEKRYLHVSNIRVKDYQQLVDKSPNDITGNCLTIHVAGWPRPFVLHTDKWEQVIEEKPIKKPRPGKNKTYGQYDWEWLLGQWVRKLL